jgi:hypothetical protein
MPHLPDKFGFEEDHEAEDKHVPVGLSAVAHDVEGLGHVAVAVITEEIVNPVAVDLGGLGDAHVPTRAATYNGAKKYEHPPGFINMIFEIFSPKILQKKG